MKDFRLTYRSVILLISILILVIPAGIMIDNSLVLDITDIKSNNVISSSARGGPNFNFNTQIAEEPVEVQSNNLQSVLKIEQIGSDSDNTAISIVSDDDFSSEGFPGSGTIEDPYRIEDLHISGVDTAISIESTTKYLIISNITVENSNTGIRFRNVNNVLIENVTISNAQTGVGIEYSDNINVTRTTIKGAYIVENYPIFAAPFYSISLFQSNVSLSDNILTDGGIYLQPSLLQNIGELEISNTTLNAKPVIMVRDQNGFTVPTNTGQVLVINSTNTVISGLDISRAFIPIVSYFSNYTTVSQNSIDTVYYGILNVVGINETITDNKISNFSQIGTIQSSSINTTISYNTLFEGYSGSTAITVENSNSNLLIGNNVTNVPIGINVNSFSRTTNIQDNFFSNSSLSFTPSSGGNLGSSTFMRDISGNNNTIDGRPISIISGMSDVVVPSNAAQVVIYNSTRITIDGINTSHVTDGILIEESSNITISNSISSQNSEHGLAILRNSGNITIQNSEFSNNKERGIYSAYIPGIHLINVTINGNEREGLVLQGHGHKIINSTISGNIDTGTYVESGANILNSTFNSNGGYGLEVRGDGTLLLYSNFSDNAGAGLSINSVDSLIRFNNFINNNAGGSQIYIEGGTPSSVGEELMFFHFNYYSSLSGTDSNGDGVIDQTVLLGTFTSFNGAVHQIYDFGALLIPTWEYTYKTAVTQTTNREFQIGTDYTLNWNVSSIRSGDYQINVNGDQVASGVFTANLTQISLDLSTYNPGQYEVELILTDNMGLISYDIFNVNIADITATVTGYENVTIYQGEIEYVRFPFNTSGEATTRLYVNGELETEDNFPNAVNDVTALFDISTLDVGIYNYTYAIFGESLIAHFTTIVTIIENSPPELDYNMFDANITYNEGTTGNVISWVIYDDNPGLYNISEDGQLLISNQSWSNGSAITYNVDGLSPGLYEFVLRIEDQYDNYAEFSIVVEVVTESIPSSTTSITTSTPTSDTSQIPSTESPVDSEPSDNLGLYFPIFSLFFIFAVIVNYRRWKL